MIEGSVQLRVKYAILCPVLRPLLSLAGNLGSVSPTVSSSPVATEHVAVHSTPTSRAWLGCTHSTVDSEPAPHLPCLLTLCWELGALEPRAWPRPAGEAEGPPTQAEACVPQHLGVSWSACWCP